MATQKPKYWYFPIPGSDKVIRCEYNAAEDRYNQHCQEMKVTTLPDRVRIEMARFSNAIAKYA